MSEQSTTIDDKYFDKRFLEIPSDWLSRAVPVVALWFSKIGEKEQKEVLRHYLKCYGKHGPHEWFHHLSDDAAKKWEEENPGKPRIPYSPHMGVGMGFRNHLREQGMIDGDGCPIPNWDDYYIAYLEFALGLRGKGGGCVGASFFDNGNTLDSWVGGIYWEFENALKTKAEPLPVAASEAVETEVLTSGATQAKETPGFDKLPFGALKLVAEVRAWGVDRYGKDNHLGIPPEESLNHAIQHIYRFSEGEPAEHGFAKGKPIGHLAQAVVRILMAMDTLIRGANYAKS